MTKQEVLQGALELNGNDKKYTVTVEENEIVIETNYYGTPKQKATFRYIVRLRNDNTYTEACFDRDGCRMQWGNFTKTKKSVSFTLGGNKDKSQDEKDTFDSEACKKVLREYLASCGYKKQGFFGVLFAKKEEQSNTEMLDMLKTILPPEITVVSFDYNAKCFGNINVELSSPDGKHQFVVDRGEIYHNGKMLCDSSYQYVEKEDPFPKLLQMIKKELDT